jgi:hypothetical protein
MSYRRQFNLRMTDDEIESMKGIAEEASEALDIPKLSITNMVMMSIGLLKDWIAHAKKQRQQLIENGTLKPTPPERED